MALSQFPVAVHRLVPALKEAADAARYIRDTSGDLTWAAISDMERKLAIAKMLRQAAFDEAANVSATSQGRVLADVGVTTSVAVFASGVTATETAATAVGTGLAAWVNGLSVTDVLEIANVTRNGVTTFEQQRVPFISGAKAAPLRTSTQLATLIAAFEAIGA